MQHDDAYWCKLKSVGYSHILSGSGKRCWHLVCVLSTVISAGCSSGTDRIEAPSFEPSTAAEKAMEMYDTSGDQQLDDSELAAIPGMAAGKERIDTNGDGQVSAAEIEARIETWMNAATTLKTMPARIVINGRPTPGAVVTFEPEPFLADWITPAKGIADANGIAEPKSAGSPLPGVSLGYYKVRVSHKSNGKEMVAPEFNEQTELGIEVTDDYQPDTLWTEFSAKSR